MNTYPGEFDLDWDGEPDTFDRAWLEDFLSILSDFQQEHGVPVAVNEFGVIRWVPNAADFMRDEMDIFEEDGNQSCPVGLEPGLGTMVRKRHRI